MELALGQSAQSSLGGVTDDKVSKLMGWWAQHLDTLYGGALLFAERSGLAQHMPCVAVPGKPALKDSEDDTVFTVPGRRLLKKTPSEPKGVALPGPEPKEKDMKPLVDVNVNAMGFNAPQLKVGDSVTLVRRITVTMPVKKDPKFRKDIREGTEVQVVSLEDEAHVGKAEIVVSVMHNAELRELRIWQNISNLRVDGNTLVSGSPSASSAGGVDEPNEKKQALDEDVYGKNVVEVHDWEDLIDDDTDTAHLVRLRALATFSMFQVMTVAPDYGENDLLVLNRANGVGAKRTEVWTKRQFASGELIIAPWTADIRERLWATGLAVSMHLPRDVVPGNRVLALDGRKRNRLEYPNPSKHVPGSTGNIFWVIERTDQRSLANLFLAYASLSAPGGLQVSLPFAHTEKYKLEKDYFPKIPLLVNQKVIAKDTKLVALDDEVIVKARARDAAGTDDGEGTRSTDSGKTKSSLVTGESREPDEKKSKTK